MRGWFVSDDKNLYARISDIVGIVRQPIESIVVIGSERFVISHAEHIRLITAIEAENADAIAVKEQMFHHSGGAFLLSDVRGYKAWKSTPEKHGVPAIDEYINVHFGDGISAWHTSIHGSDIPRFLAAMGVPNERQV